MAEQVKSAFFVLSAGPAGRTETDQPKGNAQGAAERPKKQLKRLYGDTDDQENINRDSDVDGNKETFRMTSTTRPVVFMDINIGETPAGRIKMELFSDIVPK